MHPVDFEEKVAGLVDDVNGRIWNAAVDAGFTAWNALLVEEEALEDDEDVAPRSDLGVVAAEDAVRLIRLVRPHFVSLVDGITLDDADLANEAECCLAHRLTFFPTHEHDVWCGDGLGDFVEVIESSGAGESDGGVGGEHVFGVVADLGDVDGETRLLAVATEVLADDGGVIDGDEADSRVDDGSHGGDNGDTGGFEIAVEREASCAPHEDFAEIPCAVRGVHLLAVTDLGGGPDARLHVFALSGFGSLRARENFEEEASEECDDVVRSILDDAVLVDDAVDDGERIFKSVEGFIEVRDAVCDLEEVDGDVARLLDGSSGEHVDVFKTAKSFGEREEVGALSLVPALVENEIRRRNGAALTFVLLVGDGVGELVDELAHLVEELFSDVSLVTSEAERRVAEGGAEDEACGGSDGFDAGEILEGALEEAVLDHGADSLDFGFLGASTLENVLDGVNHRLPQVAERVL